MTILSIHPESLKHYRKLLHLSQQRLAEVSQISKKTIARIEGGKTKANSHTVKCLAGALGVAHEDLERPFNEKGKKDKNLPFLRGMGYRRINSHIHHNAELAMQMVERCYGINPHLQLSLAPLMVALLAEGSLAWRRQKLAAADEAIKKLEEADYGHMGFSIGAGHIKDQVYATEEESINQRDVFGEQTLDHAFEEHSVDQGTINPFVEYLCHLAKLARENDSNLVKVMTEEGYENQEDPAGRQWLAATIGSIEFYFSINAGELDRLVGDNEWAGRALQWGCVKIADIPEELRGDDALEKRVEWLEDRIPPAQRAEYESYWEDIRIDLGIPQKR